MKFKVPFHYAVRFRPYRKINDMSTYFASETEIEIREVKRSAVETAFRVGTLAAGRKGSPKWQYDDPYCAKPDGSLREIVSFEGVLWVEALPLEEVAASLADNGGRDSPFHDKYRFDLRATKKPDREGKLPQITASRAELERRHPSPFRDFHDDSGEKIRRKLEQRARSTIVLEGKVYVRCGEPQLYIDHKYGTSKLKFGTSALSWEREGVDVATQGGYRSEDTTAHYYSLTDAASGIADVLRRHPTDEIVRIAAFEVVDPSAVRATPHAAAVETHALAALAALWQYPMAMLPDAVECAVELRNALAAANQQVTPRLLRAITNVASLPEPSVQQMDRWRKFAAARPIRPGEMHGRSEPSRAAAIVAHSDQRTKAVTHAADALRRFTSRPPGMSWEERAFRMNALKDSDSKSTELLSIGIVTALANRFAVDPQPFIAGVADGGRIFAITRNADNDYSMSAAVAMMLAEPYEGSYRIRGVASTDSALVERHIEAALASEPNLAPARGPEMGMTP